ncbi:MAG: pimeloyl-ACP methyl ester carboxylesterase [Crocinitomix sp.]|jgi:pimeloyl-ACP methyl ester carboxylesterase
MILFTAGNYSLAQTSNASISYADFTAKQQCYNSSDGIIKFIDEGEGIPIVLLHGVPTSGWLYRKMIPELSTKGYRVIVPDMLGFGNSACPNGKGIYSPKNHARRLVELMDHLKITSWTQVAHDASSLWTAEMLRQNPNCINRLVLMNTVLNPNGINWKNQLEIGLTAKVGLAMQRLGLQKGSFVTKFIKDNLVDTRLSQAELNGYEQAVILGKTEAIFAHYIHMFEMSIIEKDQLPEFNGPVAVIWGELDEGLKWAPQAAKIKEHFQIKPEDLHLLATGHLVPEEKANEAAELIMNFVNPK